MTEPTVVPSHTFHVVCVAEMDKNRAAPVDLAHAIASLRMLSGERYSTTRFIVTIITDTKEATRETVRALHGDVKDLFDAAEFGGVMVC